MFRSIVPFLGCVLFSVAVVAQKSTASAQVHQLERTFEIQSINTHKHKVWVYLPKNYTTSNVRYPVIYMHDGQNLFDAETSYAGEWGVDEFMDDLYDQTRKGFIVVGIENAGVERINEYTPWPNEKYGGGKGALYMRFIVDELKPFIDRNFRTKKNAKNTALIGSSLGGLISFYGGLEYPQVFGKIGAFSTSFWFSEEVKAFIADKAEKARIKLYLIVGQKEGYGMDVSNRETHQLLLKNNFNKNNLFFYIDPEGEHNEAFWRRVFPDAIKWLFNY